MKRPARHSGLQREFGLKSWSGHPVVMTAAHRHNDVEINFLERGAVVYLSGGSRVAVESGQVLAFWAAAPHQLVQAAPDTHMHWLTLSPAWLLHRRLPERFVHHLLRGQPLLGPFLPSDPHLVVAWQRDLRQAGEGHNIVMLEVEARLRRLALGVSSAPAVAAPSNSSRHKAEAMARTIAQRFDEPLSIDDIAATVQLHPNYAMHLFRREFGQTINAYLTQQRVAHAQRLLITTGDDVLKVAMDAGFGSSSQFYSAFKRVCGQSPSAYRDAIQSGAG